MWAKALDKYIWQRAETKITVTKTHGCYSLQHSAWPNEMWTGVTVPGCLTSLREWLTPHSPFAGVADDAIADWFAFEAAQLQPAEPDQRVKRDAGKPDLAALLAMPIEALAMVAVVRSSGISKYGGGTDGVSRDRWLNGILRHMHAECRDPGSVDVESGLPHLAHVAVGAILAMGAR